MKTISALTLLSVALLCVPTAHAAIIDSFGTGTNSFTMIFEPIGNPGNAADTTGNPNPAGSVAYNYNMGKYEVSRDMINKANAEGGLGITLWELDEIFGNRVNRPATGLSWNETARFVNWMNTSQGYSPAYKFSIQPGQPGYNPQETPQSWQSSDAGYDPNNLVRNRLAQYSLPSLDEWYKAAYYDPNVNGGTGGYWNYATGSDTLPTAVSSGTDPGTAVYGQDFLQGPADITNAGGLSPYGVMGLGGNVRELQETLIELENTDLGTFQRGGDWERMGSFMSASHLFFGAWSGDESFVDVGFRVSRVPEPSSAALLMLASVGLWQRRKRSS